MVRTITDGELVVQEPTENLVYLFDWDAFNLATSVTISNSSWTLSVVEGANTTPLTNDNPSIVTGSRKTQTRIQGGTEGTEYKIENTITTNESPAQIKVRSFRMLIGHRAA